MEFVSVCDMKEVSQLHRPERIDHDHLEPSPSTGYRDVFAVMGATAGIGEPDPRATVENDDYLKDFFGVSS